MNEMGVSAAGITSESLRQNPRLWSEVDSGKYRFIFASPEVLLMPQSYFWHKIASKREHPFVKGLMRVGGSIVVDECHMVWRWGESGFRKEYRNIGYLRTYFPTVPFLLLSATIAPNVRGYLHRTLGMASPTYLMQRSIRRENLRLLCARSRYPGYQDLDFLIPTDVGVPLQIAKTMVFVDSKVEAQLIVGYLRKRLHLVLGADQGFYDKEAVVCVYSAAHSPVTREAHMQYFLDGDCRILVCTDAAGMGMDIPNIQIVVQFRISKNLTLADLWQRLGRCARDQKIHGLAVVFVADHILPDGVKTQFVQKVEYSRRADILAFTRNLYSTDPNSVYRDLKIDPPLLWMLNTHGCRVQVLLASFDDPDTYSSAKCSCDNCSFPPRLHYNRRLPPPELVLPNRRFARGERIRMKKQLEKEHSNIIRLRSTAIHGLQLLGKTHMYGFTMSRTLRYEDTVAFESDLVQEQLHKDIVQAADPKTSPALVTTVTEKLTALRCEVFERDWAGLCIPINDFFPFDVLEKIAQNSARICTVEVLNTVLGSKYNLPTSYLKRYALDIMKIIHDEATAERDSLPADQLEAATGSMAGQPRGREPPRHRKRKYDGIVPEHLLNPDDPKDAQFLSRQREMLAYDKRILEESTERWRERQQDQAVQTVRRQALKAATNKKQETLPGKY